MRRHEERRGWLRTFETALRNTFDVSAVPVVQQATHLPIIADPSHATGFRDKVAPMARAAVAAGADGLMVEVHHDPAQAKSDGPQSLYPEQFEELMQQLRQIECRDKSLTHLVKEAQLAEALLRE